MLTTAVVGPFVVGPEVTAQSSPYGLPGEGVTTGAVYIAGVRFAVVTVALVVLDNEWEKGISQCNLHPT